MNIIHKLTLGLTILLTAGTTLTTQAEVKQPKWLVLNPMTYQNGVDRHVFDGIDKLLLTKLVQAKKYKCLDRDEYDTAAREGGLGANVQIVPAGYSMSGEIVQLQPSGKSRLVGATRMTEFIATVSIRANDLRTQQPYEADTFRVTAYCQTPKDMLVHTVQRTALAILMRDYPPRIMAYDEEEGTLTINYGGDFLSVGQQFEVRKREELVDEDTGDVVYKEKSTGVLEIVDVSKNTSEAKLVSGKAKVKSVLRFYENADSFAPPVAKASDEIVAQPGVLPQKRFRIAVAPFFAKVPLVNVRGMRLATRTWMDDAKSHLVTALTKCNRFKVLDRDFGGEVDRELNRIANDPNANPKDMDRLANKLAADNLVVAEIVFSDVVSPGRDYATGRPLPPPSSIFAEVRYRCVVAPTTEIAWSDVVKLDSQCYGGSVEQFSSESAASVAQQMADRLWNRFDEKDFAAELKRREAAAAALPPPAPAPVAPVSTGVRLGF